ncbi:uncharacterized protein LOC144443263 isoform X2 [Glandiceps talaboti]
MATASPKLRVKKGRVTPTPPVEDDRSRSPGLTDKSSEDEKKSKGTSQGTGSVISVKEASTSGRQSNIQVSPEKLLVKQEMERPGSAGSGKKLFKPNIIEPTDQKLNSENGVHQTATAWSAKNGEGGSPRSRPRSAKSVGKHSIMSDTTLGSLSSLHSIITVEEARPESRLDGVGTDADTKSLMSLSSRSQSQLQAPELEGNANAYVPYSYARDCLARVMDDMTRMKVNHVKIVHQIEDNYKLIEDETQGQFNMFVISLRENYSSKVKTFKQVIEIHRVEFDRHQKYWDETLASLSTRNRQLLKDKKRLLIINKVEIDRLEKEKEQVQTDLTHKIDNEHHKYVLASKDLDNVKKQHEEEIDNKNRENKIVQDQLESEKEENERLRAMLKSKPGGAAAVAAVAAAATTTTTVVKSLEAEERKKYESEIQKSEKELAIMRAKYEALNVQFQHVAVAAAQDKEKTQETLVVVVHEKDDLQEEKAKVDKEIKQWEEDFKKKKGREPTVKEKEKSKSVKELNHKSEEMEKKITQLDVQIETLETLKEGKVPEPVEVKVPEPVVKTVEVTVPDPTLVAALGVAEKQSAEHQQRILELEEMLKEKDKTIKEKDKTIKEKDKTIKHLEKDKKKLSKTKSQQHLPVKSVKEDKNLRIVLEAVIKNVHGIHGEVKKAADKTSARLKTETGQKKELVTTRDQIKDDIEKWVEKYTEENGKEPSEGDRDTATQNLYSRFEAYNAKCLNNETDIVALTMMKTGEIPEEFGTLSMATVVVAGATATGASAEEMQELEDRIKLLEEENESLNDKNSELEDKTSDLEDKVDELEEELQRLQIEGVAGTGEVAVSGGAGLAVGVAAGGGGAAAPAAALALTAVALDEDVEELGDQMTSLQAQVDDAEARLRDEKLEHGKTKQELEDLKLELERLSGDVSGQSAELEAKLMAKQKQLEAELKAKDKDLSEAKQKIDELEQEKLKKLPPDSAAEIRKLQEKLKKAEAEKQASDKAVRAKTAELDEIKPKVTNLSQSLAKEREINRGHQDKLKQKMADKDKEMKEMAWQLDKKASARADEEKNRSKALEKKVKELQVAVAAGGTAAARGAKSGAADDVKVKKLQEQVTAMKKQIREDQDKIKQFEKDAKEARVAASQDKSAKKADKQLKELEKKLEIEKKKFEREQKRANELDEELTALKKELSVAQEQTKKLDGELAALGVAAKEGIAAAEKVTSLEAEVKKLNSENKSLTDNWNSERVLRKKYYNMVEDMKGKIRVYCRSRPLSKDELGRGNFSVIKSPDEYTISVTSSRGTKEFQYDQIFTSESTQEKVFEDSNNLIQSAVDGYNVCIFAYGQTGSGKTFTMIGDSSQQFPGIAPRAFKQIFDLVEENKKKYSFTVSSYMLELYNDKLIDLYNTTTADAKLDIKKDKKGMVVVQGAVVQSANNSKELFGLFEEGSRNRHVASTKMNAESSRSHLIIGIVIESTNLTTGTVTKGKLSLVDLAGSERASKTGASAEQLKEAQSINKSLSALGDVISALSSDQSFIPYRNNKLTLLMQDSLGGNAKTLMFVNISPADYNADETVISLTYASRVKLITNDASKNADNKEIARLKDVIAKLKKGESVEEEE